MTQIKISRMTVVEGIVIYISLGWTASMFTNNKVFDQSENFEQMEFLAQKEWVIGVICLILAMIKLFGVLLKKVNIRRIGLLLSSVFWVLVSASFLLSAEKFELNTGFIVYSAIALMCLWTSKEVIAHDRAE